MVVGAALVREGPCRAGPGAGLCGTTARSSAPRAPPALSRGGPHGHGRAVAPAGLVAAAATAVRRAPLARNRRREGRTSSGRAASAVPRRLSASAAEAAAGTASLEGRPRFLILGGSGKIGTIVAAHLAQRLRGQAELVLAGRDPARGASAVEEVRQEAGAAASAGGLAVEFRATDWSAPGTLQALLTNVQPDAVLHTAGPFDSDMDAGVLEAVIAAKVPIYVDVADPVPYLDAAKRQSAQAQESDIMALVSSGAFPGFSNVLGLECARRLGPGAEVKDLDFAYFTAGLGGSGAVNLLITNLGFGEPMHSFQDGKPIAPLNAGTGMRKRDFFLESGDAAFQAVGEQDVWSWPFPEASTVAKHLDIAGSSRIGMGTAPGIWNDILVLLVALVPRDLWRERWFSEGLAWFSLPMVWVTDKFVGETHAMRVEATAVDGRKCVAVQVHESFRRCVAQSMAEFALDLLERRRRRADADAPWRPGVWLPEELADDAALRPGLLERLSSTKGTIFYGFSEQ